MYLDKEKDFRLVKIQKFCSKIHSTLKKLERLEELVHGIKKTVFKKTEFKNICYNNGQQSLKYLIQYLRVSTFKLYAPKDEYMRP